MEEQKPGFLRAFANANPVIVLGVLFVWGVTTFGAIVLTMSILAPSFSIISAAPVFSALVIGLSWSSLYWLMMWLIALVTGMAAPPTLRGTGPESGSFSRKEKI